MLGLPDCGRSFEWPVAGRPYTTQGWICYELAPGHPRARKGNYVFEHILVMEQILGRHLVSDAIAWAREILARYEGNPDTSNNAQGLH